MLEAFEDVLVALFTSSDARTRFRMDRAGLLSDLELTDPEKSALLALDEDALDRYARSLIGKRWGDVARVIPLTLRISPRLGNRYRRWAANHRAPILDTVLSPGCNEALRALEHLAAELRRDPAEACYAADLLAFEVLSTSSRADGAERKMNAAHALDEIVADLRKGLVPIDPDPRPTHFVFDRGRIRWNR